MKKFKAVMGVALICALAFTCFAFAACGDSTFNIDTSKQATNDELKSFNENVASANADYDDETGLPVAFAGKSFKVVMDLSIGMHEASANVDMGYKLDGIINATEKPTAKLKGDTTVSATAAGTTSEQKGQTEVTIVDDAMYVYTKNDTVTTKEKYLLSDLVGSLPGFDTLAYAGSSATDDATDQTVEEFLKELKAAFAQLGVTVDPKLYIDGGVMKVQLTDDSYIGVAYDDDWHLKAIDVMLKDLSATMSGMTISVGVEFTMRVASAETVTAPSDAGDYTPKLFPGI